MATRLSLNESAEDLMPMTMEISLNQFANPEEEAENIRKFMEKSGRVAVALRSDSSKFASTGWIPTQRVAKIMARNTAPAHRTEDKENVARQQPNDAAQPRGGSISQFSGTLLAGASKGKRSTPKQRRGTGRAVTARPFEFRKRIAVEEEPAAPESVREMLPSKGRRTGIRMKQDIPKDDYGMEDLDEFWDAVEEEPAALEPSPTKSSRRVSFKQSVEFSPVSHRSSMTGRQSFNDSTASSMSVAGSESRTLSEEQSDMDVDGDQLDEDESPSSSSRRTSFATSVGSASGSRRVSERISTGGKGLGMTLDTIDACSVTSSKGSAMDSSILSPDPNTIKKLAFEEGSGRRRSSASSRASPGSLQDEESRASPGSPKAASSRASPGSPKAASSRASSGSPRAEECNASSGSPKVDESLAVKADEEEESREESMHEGHEEQAVPDYDEAPEQEDSMEQQDDAGDEQELQDENVGQKVKRKRDTEGRKRELEALAKSGRASYGATDSYATKQSRLSMFAPRPEVDDEEDVSRRSKRRKMRPLEYWRNECVVYQRANKSPKSSAEAAQNSRGSKILAKSAVPEICDVIIRSPEATPWRRKYPKKAGHDDTEQGTSSVDSKSATVKKKARSQKKKDKKQKKDKKANRQEESMEEEQEDNAVELEHPEVEESGQDPLSSIKKKKKKSIPQNEAQVADKEESDRQVPSSIKKTKKASAVVEGNSNQSPPCSTVKSPPTRKSSLVVEEQSNQSTPSSIKKTKISPKRRVSVKAESISKDSFAFKKQNTPQKRESTASSVGDMKRKTAFFLFCKERRPDVRRMHPNAPIPEQAMVLSEMWRGLSDGQKLVYRKMEEAA